MTYRSLFAFGLLLGLCLLFSRADADNHHKKNKDSAALTECTIQSSGSGGGCKGGFKRVCQKLKNGDKCCGCVADKNAEPAKTTGGDQPSPKFDCVSDVLDYTLFAANEAEARSKYDASLKARTPPLTPKGPVTCTKVQ